MYNDLLTFKNYLIDNNIYSNDGFIIFRDSPATPFYTGTIYARKESIAKSAKLKVIRLHDFRHSCASLLINSGANVTVVAKYLGHSEIEETLNTYSHMFPHALNEVINVINTVNTPN